MKAITRNLLLMAVVPMGIMLLFRMCYLCTFISPEIIRSCQTSIPLLMFNSLRFDLQVTAYTMLLPTMLAFFAFYRPLRNFVIIFSLWPNIRDTVTFTFPDARRKACMSYTLQGCPAMKDLGVRL